MGHTDLIVAEAANFGRIAHDARDCGGSLHKSRIEIHANNAARAYDILSGSEVVRDDFCGSLITGLSFGPGRRDGEGVVDDGGVKHLSSKWPVGQVRGIHVVQESAVWQFAGRRARRRS
jgi:hypothetical protein